MPAGQLRLRIERELVPDGHGADDYETDEGVAYTLRAVNDGRHVGELRYSLVDEALIWVRWIETDLSFQRRGVARALITEAQRLHPDADVDTGGLTDEGRELWAALFG